MTQEDFPAGGDRFPATRRSVIEAVRSFDAEERESALESLCAAYWKPVYKYVRLRWNRTPDAAQDLTQGFFVELLERELLDKFDAKKSRLRTYLRLCVDSFVMNEDKAGRRQKRGGNVQHVAIDFSAAEEEMGAQPVRACSRGIARTLHCARTRKSFSSVRSLRPPGQREDFLRATFERIWHSLDGRDQRARVGPPRISKNRAGAPARTLRQRGRIPS